MPELTDVEKAMLVLEGTPYTRAGAKERDIRDQFDISPNRFWQIVNALMDRPEAEAWNPQLVHRLQRIRKARQRQRSARGRGVDLG